MQFTTHLNRFIILLLSTLALIASSAQAEESHRPPALANAFTREENCRNRYEQ